VVVAMSKGHVVLDGVEYVLPDQGAITRSNANQMAAKQGSGAGDYEDLEDWSALLLDNWQSGVGKRDVEGGGYLFGTADTRFEGQIVMPPRLIPPNASTGATSYGSSIALTTSTKVAYSFTLGAADQVEFVTVLLPGAINEGDASSMDVLLYNDAAGVPGTSVGGFVVDRAFAPEYQQVTLSTVAIGTGNAGTYYVVIAPLNGTCTLLGSPTGGFYYNGSSWASGFCPAVGVHINTPANDLSFEHMAAFNTDIYLADDTTKLYKLVDDDTFTTIKTFAGPVSDLLALGDILYIGLGDSANYQTMNTSDVVSTSPSVPARLFALWNGLLYRAVGATVSYSADGSTWETAIDIADSGYLVRGMAGFQSDLIVSTDNALYRMAPGDVVLRITPWANVSSTNGAHMLNWQGNLYISQGESLLRYDGAGLLPFGPDLGEGLPELEQGQIVGLAANNNWLLCAVEGERAATIWAHNGQGWHCLQRTTWPLGHDSMAVRCLAYGESFRGTGYVTSAGRFCTWYSFKLPDTARSTYKIQENEEYLTTEPTATLETDWFYGSLKEVDKDWESIFIDGDGISVSNYVRVYWQQDDDDEWRSLGTVTSGGQELRWDDYDTRPNARRMKFKLTFVHLDIDNPYRVIAVRVKYMPMVRDRWRWSIPLMVHNRQNMLDGSLNRRNRLVQARHLDGLTNQVPPFIFQDTDGSRYEVKVMNATRQTTKVQYLPESGETQVEYIYNLVIEQVNADEYTGD
jgi:hypothetical protein